MSDREVDVPVEASQALLDSLREVKGEFRAVDAAVANHFRNGRERAARRRIGRGALGAWVLGRRWRRGSPGRCDGC